MIDLEQLHDLPLLTFPTVVRDALRVYPLQGSWSDEGDYYLDLDIPDAFNRMLQEVSEDLPDFFYDRLNEVIRDYTGGHQFHRFASGEILVDEQGLRVTKEEFIPADMYDVPRKEKVTWKVQPPAELLIPGARVQFQMIISDQNGGDTVGSVTWAGVAEPAPPAFEPWAEELKRVFAVLGAEHAETMQPDIPESLASIPELFGSWTYVSLYGIYDLSPEMLLTLELGGSKTDRWETEDTFDYVEL